MQIRPPSTNYNLVYFFLEYLGPIWTHYKWNHFCCNFVPVVQYFDWTTSRSYAYSTPVDTFRLITSMAVSAHSVLETMTWSQYVGVSKQIKARSTEKCICVELNSWICWGLWWHDIVYGVISGQILGATNKSKIRA